MSRREGRGGGGWGAASDYWGWRRARSAELIAYERATAFFATEVAGTLVDLGVFDAIGDGRRTAEDLAAELDLDADNLHRTLRLAAARRLDAD